MHMELTYYKELLYSLKCNRTDRQSNIIRLEQQISQLEHDNVEQPEPGRVAIRYRTGTCIDCMADCLPKAETQKISYKSDR